MADTQSGPKPTLGLTGVTMNAMALIAPGAFLWITFQLQAAATAPDGSSVANDTWAGIGAALIIAFLTAISYGQLARPLGTNAVATAQMMKARANRGASGENAIVRTVPTADVILGCLSIVLANAMMGEVTPKMAEAIASAKARKILLPLTQEAVEIVGLTPEPLPHLVERIVSHKLREII